MERKYKEKIFHTSQSSDFVHIKILKKTHNGFIINAPEILYKKVRNHAKKSVATVVSNSLNKYVLHDGPIGLVHK